MELTELFCGLSEDRDASELLAVLQTWLGERCGRCALRLVTPVRPGRYQVLVPGGAVLTRAGELPWAAGEAARMRDAALAEALGLDPGEAMVAVPVCRGGRVSRWVVLGGPGMERVNEAELALLGAVANLYGAQAERARFKDRLARAEAWITEELDQVAAVQRALQPDLHAVVPGLEVAVLFQPLARAGGDYYDIVALPFLDPPDWRAQGLSSWGAMVADAAGHGAGAAVEAAMLDAILRTYPGVPDGGPAAVLDYVNRHLFTRRIRGTFITAVALNHLPAQGRLTYANAGHHPALLRRRTGGVEVLGDGAGVPLGVLQDTGWENRSVAVADGDLVVAYTDGIVEATSPSGEALGLERLAKTLDAAKAEPTALVDAVTDALAAHAHGAPARDDQTLLAIRLSETPRTRV
jgi:sigma-B regulation protein RsbU (phosphoserine phosphatase)